jgi:hypothetical protein
MDNLFETFRLTATSVITKLHVAFTDHHAQHVASTLVKPDGTVTDLEGLLSGAGIIMARGYPARVTSAEYVSPGVSGARTAGTLIGNDTGGAGHTVVPITFTMARPKGRISACRAVVTPVSGTLVYDNLDFDLVLYEAFTAVPFAAGSYPGNNAAVTFADNAKARANQLKRLGTFSFNKSSWRKGNNQIITATVTGMSGTQKVGLLTGEQFVPFDLTGAEEQRIRALAVIQSAWNDGNVANNFDLILDVDYD